MTRKVETKVFVYLYGGMWVWELVTPGRIYFSRSKSVHKPTIEQQGRQLAHLLDCEIEVRKESTP